MKTPQYTIFIALFVISTLSISGFQAFAQESDAATGAAASAETGAQIKVDAGNALNALQDAIGDLDSDGYGDVSIREGGQTVDAGTIPEKQQVGNDNSGNNSGENKPSTDPNYLDDDSDDDGISDGTEKEIEVVEYRNGDDKGAARIGVDASTPLLMTALSMDATTPLLYDGVRVSINADSCDPGKSNDCDDEDEDVSPSASFALNVSGNTVRGWAPNQKEALQTHANAVVAVDSPHNFGIWLVENVIQDESIEDVDVDDRGVVLTYRNNARLFGFIPISLRTTARHMGRMKVGDVTLETNNDSEIEIDYPWYGFLITKDSSHNQEMVALTAEIATNYNASLTAATKFKAGKALADTVK